MRAVWIAYIEKSADSLLAFRLGDPTNQEVS